MKSALRIALLAIMMAAGISLHAREWSFSVSGTLKEVLGQIQKECGYSILYKTSDLDLQVRITKTFNNASIETVLESVLEGQDVRFTITGKAISIARKTGEPAFSVSGNGIPLTLTGQVIEADTGNPVLGAALVDEVTGKGTVTDMSGNFSINVTPGTRLIVSCLGYEESVFVCESDPGPVVIRLELQNEVLDDVVVVGYTKRSREKLISSVSSLEGDQLVKSHTPNLENALSGRMSGVFSRQTSGEPGNDSGNIQIRGFGSALVVVDGIPGRSYSELDPNEIESISVLKDASAAAVYGMQGANGVILVTTKRGKRNRPTTFDVSAQFGVQQATNYPETADYNLWQTLVNEYNMNQRLILDKNAVAAPGSMDIAPSQYDTDWYDTLVGLAPIEQVNLSISGGTDKINYFISGGYIHQSGIWKTHDTGKNRFNVRSNIDADITDNLTASVGIGIIINDVHYPGTGSAVIARSIKDTAPNIPVRWSENDAYYAFGGEGTSNPMALADANASGYMDNSEKTTSVDVSLNYDAPFAEGLSFKATVSYQYEASESKNWYKTIPYIGYRADANEYYESVSASESNKASMSIINGNTTNLVGQLYASYNRTFNNAHTVNAGIVYEINVASNRSVTSQRTNFPSAITDWLNAGLASQGVSNNEYERKYRSLSLVERFSYDYKNRYFIDVNCRLDGAQYFSKKWGFFPSVSLGWMLSNEPFIKDNGVSNVLKELKIRASYGILGDLSAAKSYYDNNEQYYWQSGWTYPGSEMVFGDRPLYSLVQTVNANPDFTWSTSAMTNVGIDFRLFDYDMLSGSVEFFYRRRSGLPAMKANDNAGALATYYNLDSDNTRGIDISLNHSHRIGDFGWSAGINLSWSRSKYGHVEHTAYSSGYDAWRNNNETRWTNVRWGYKVIGRYQSYEEIANAPIHANSNNNNAILPGDLKYEDVNQDGYIDEKDMQPIGRTAYPEMMFGLNLGFIWKGLDFSALFQGGALGDFTIGEFDMDAFAEGRTDRNTWAYFADRWHKADYTDPNSDWIPGHFPAIRDMNSVTINRYDSDFWMFDGSYLRLKNVEIGYTFNIGKHKKNATDLRIYFSAYNLFTISSQPFFDPEQAESITSFAAYPQVKSYSFGLNLKF